MNIRTARDFAINAHWGQKYGARPYIHHLDDVASIVKQFKLPDFVQAAAYLHDVVEDTEVTANEVSNKFGYEIATLVYAVTDCDLNVDEVNQIEKDYEEQDQKNQIRRAKKMKTYPKILAHPFGVHLKLCDRIANVRASSIAKDLKMFSKYRSEAALFEKSLRTPGVADKLWAALEAAYAGTPEAQEI